MSLLDELDALDAIRKPSKTKDRTLLDDLSDLDAARNGTSKVAPLNAPPSVNAIPGNAEVTNTSQPGKPQLSSWDKWLNPRTLADRWRGAGETALSVGTGMIATPVGAIAGIVKGVTGGKYGTPEGALDAAKTAEGVTDTLTYRPRSETGQEYISDIGKAVDKSKIGGIGPNEAVMLGNAIGMGKGATDQLRTQFEARKYPQNPIPVGSPETAVIAPRAEVVPGKPNLKLAVEPQKVEVIKPEEVISSPVADIGPKLASPAEQGQRAEILRRIGLDDVRKSAIANDAKGASTDFQTSKLDNSAGNYMRATLDRERQALQGHAERIIEDTGGTLGIDESARIARGNAIVAPLDNLKEWFDTGIKKLYSEAHAQAADVPVQTPTLGEIVGKKSDFLGTVEGKQLLEGVQSRMKDLGMLDKEGNLLPTTAKNGELLRQYIGDQWSPRTSRLIGKLKDAIDDDVFSAAGENIYKESRALRELRSNTLDNPKGIAKLMDSSGPGGINRAVPVEKMADSVAGMPVDQLKHVIKTLNEVPPELAPQSQAALAEIKSHFANKIMEAGSSRVGQWGARDVSKYLKNNAEKLKQVFTPEELARIKDLNDAGLILAKDQSYPGASVQEHNLMQRGAMTAIKSGSMAAGSAVAGIQGAAAGGAIGGFLANKFGDRAALRAAQERTVRLSDIGR